MSDAAEIAMRELADAHRDDIDPDYAEPVTPKRLGTRWSTQASPDIRRTPMNATGSPDATTTAKPPWAAGTVIEIVERKPAVGGFADNQVVPNEVRVNGQRVLVSGDHPVQIHPIRSDEVVLVTLTLMAQRVVIGREDPEVAA